MGRTSGSGIAEPGIGFEPDRPSGYPRIPAPGVGLDEGLAGVAVLQHVLGLATGVLVYSLLLRIGLRRWLATAVAAAVLLDAYTITLEQTLLTEPLFSFAVVLAV